MADRYWRGGTGTWNTTNTTNWSTTNGGAGGASVPTAADNVFFTSLSGGGTCTNSGTNPCLSCNMTGYTGTFAGTGTVNMNGSLTLSASGSLTFTGTFGFAAGATTSTINTNGKTIPGNITSSKTSGTLRLDSAITMGGTFTVSSASLSINQFTLTCAYFSYSGLALSWGTTPGKVVVSRSTTGSGLFVGGTSILSGGRIEILSPPSGVQVNLFGNISAVGMGDLPDVYFINSGTGTINHNGIQYRTLDVGAGSYAVSGTPYVARLCTISPSYTGTLSGGMVLQAIDTNGIDFNPNGKTFAQSFTVTTLPTNANGACPIRINQSVTFTDTTNVSSWYGGQLSIENNSTLTVDAIRLDPRPTLNNSTLNFPGTSKIVLTKSTSGNAIIMTSSYYVRMAGIANNNPIEVTAPPAGVTLTILLPEGGDGTTGRTDCIGIKVKAGGTGVIRFEYSFSGGSSPITLKDLICENGAYTLSRQYLSDFQIARNLTIGGSSIVNNLSTFWFVSNSAVVQEVSMNGTGGSGSWILNNSSVGPVRLMSDAGGTGLGNQIGSIYFGDANTGGSGQGYLELQSYTLTVSGNLQFAAASSPVNIDYGTGKIRFYSESPNAVTFSSYNDAYSGTITGSRQMELLPFGNFADNYTRQLNIPNAPVAGKELSVRVVNTGSTGRVLLSLIQASLILENGPYTYGIGSSSTEMYGNITLLGSILFDSAFIFNAPAAAVTSTITSNGNTFNTTFTLNGSGHTTILADALICKTINFGQGTLNLNDNSLTISTGISISGSSTRTLNMGTTGSITLAQNATFTTTIVSNLTLSGTSRQIFATVGASGGAILTTASSPSESFAFDVTTVVVGSGGTVYLDGSVRDLTLNAGTYTVNRAATYTIYGNLLMNGAVTSFSGGATALNFSKASGTQTINTNGNNFGGTGGITFTTGATKQLVGNSNFNDVACTLSSGTLDLNSFRLTVFSFNTSNSNVRTLAFGASGAIQLRGSGTAFNASTQTNLTVTGTNRTIEPNLNSSQTITIGTANPPLFDVSVPSTASNNTLTITTTNTVRNLTFANVSYTVANSSVGIYGSLTILGTTPTFSGGSNPWTFSATSGSHTITTNGKPIPFPITINGVGGTFALNDDLTLSSARTFTLTNGTLDLSTRTLTTPIFNSSNSNTRVITFGTGSKIVVNNGGTCFDTTTTTNLTVTGTNRTVELQNAGVASTVQAGTTASYNTLFDLVVNSGYTNTVTTRGYWRNVTYQNGSYTIAAPALGTERVYGNFAILGTSPTIGSGSTALTFAATTGTNTIQTSGKTMGFPFNFNGVGGTWQLVDAWTVAAGVINTLTNGTFDANNFNVTMGSFESNNSNVRTLQMGNATWTLSDSSTFWNITTSTNMTLTRGTGASAAIVTTGTAAKTFQGGGLIYPRLTHSSNSVLTIAGTNTRFADITRGIAAATTFTFTSGQTFFFDDWNLSGVSTGARTVVNSTSGTRHILSKSSGTVSSDFLSLTSSEATGGAAWYAGTGSLNNSNNVGWIFTAPPQASGNMLMVFM